MFLFPSWLFHQVRPYRGDALRISIAFDELNPARTGLRVSHGFASNKRQSQIVRLLRQSGRVAVEDLAAQFSVATANDSAISTSSARPARWFVFTAERSSPRASRISLMRPGSSSHMSRRD